MLLSRRSVNRAPNLHSKVGAEVVKKEGNSSRSSKSQHGKSASSSSRHDGTGERLLSARLLSAWLSTWLLSARHAAGPARPPIPAVRYETRTPAVVVPVPSLILL